MLTTDEWPAARIIGNLPFGGRAVVCASLRLEPYQQRVQQAGTPRQSRRYAPKYEPGCLQCRGNVVQLCGTAAEISQHWLRHQMRTLTGRPQVGRSAGKPRRFVRWHDVNHHRIGRYSACGSPHEKKHAQQQWLRYSSDVTEITNSRRMNLCQSDIIGSFATVPSWADASYRLPKILVALLPVDRTRRFGSILSSATPAARR